MNGLTTHPSPSGMEDSLEVTEKFQWVKQKTTETGGTLRTMELAQEFIAIKYHERLQLEGLIHHQRSGQSTEQRMTEQDYNALKERLEAELRQRLGGLMQQQREFLDKIAQNLTDLNWIQTQILSLLFQWKSEEQLSRNGPSLDPTGGIQININTIQSCCEDLGELIWTNRNQLKGLERLRQKLSQNIRMTQSQNDLDRLTTLQNDVNLLLSNLVKSTFIVEKQPPQIIKKGSKFEAAVRLLVGKTLNVQMTSPTVHVTIISDEEARTLVSTGKCGKSGEILNNKASMKFQPDTNDLSVRFRNLQLEKIRRSEKREGFTVTEEKFCLVFQSQFTIGEMELQADIWTLSHPVVVTVHANQEAHSWATITWDNAFGQPMRSPFDTPTGVPWCQLSETLNRKFNHCTGRALTPDNLSFLAGKIFGLNPSQVDPQRVVTWSRFCKRPLTDRNFSFWDWFYAIMKLTVDHLKGPWTDGSILGFLGRQQAIDVLSTCQIGTFLLRFSDSELGAVTISWIHSDKKVYSLEPQTAKNLLTRCMADCINDISYLTFLYPDIPKENAFNQYISPPQMPSSCVKDYVKRGLKTFVPLLSTGPSTSNNDPSNGSFNGHNFLSVSPNVSSPLSEWTSSPGPPSNMNSPMGSLQPGFTGSQQLTEDWGWTIDMLLNEEMDSSDLVRDGEDLNDIVPFV